MSPALDPLLDPELMNHVDLIIADTLDKAITGIYDDEYAPEDVFSVPEPVGFTYEFEFDYERQGPWNARLADQP